ncbi:MAG: hypothetical protein JRN52_09980 [Nitrososphaerota archaeon]|nr:hypothetical protein [Nitrososphaerota archaeon]
MSLNQSRVYLYLLSNGSVSARNISEDPGLHRVDVYRKLRDLVKLGGGVEMYLGPPKNYVAIAPKVALTRLLSEMELRIGDLQRALRSLEYKLAEFRLTHSNSNKRAPSTDVRGTYYRIGHGSERHYAEIARTIRQAKKEVITVVSAKGVK